MGFSTNEMEKTLSSDMVKLAAIQKNPIIIVTFAGVVVAVFAIVYGY